MRFLKLLLWDIRFQIKYGFYFLYTVLTLLYIFIIFLFKESVRGNVSTIFIYTDPAAMGLFFMGSIILLEKNQKLPNAYSVSPISESSYVGSKLLSLGFISVIVALILANVGGSNNIFYVILGTFLAGSIFTLFGIIIATKIKSLNQFIIWSIPVETACFIPSLLHLFGVSPSWLKYYPPNACMDLISGKLPNAFSLILLVISIVILFLFATRSVKKMWNTSGGGSL